ncbi:MAG: hypothetical protein ACRD9Q_01200 [Nitrososphaeraceae archaeon]
MTPKEQLVYNYIKKNPGISSAEVCIFAGGSRHVQKLIQILKEKNLVKYEYVPSTSRLFAVKKK